MFKREVIKIEKNEKVSEHVFYSGEEAKGLVLFFPGGSSNTSGPYFYYLRDFLLRDGYDVLSLSYKAIVTKGDSYDVQVEKISTVIELVLENVQKTKTYDKKILASRSFGNIMSGIIREKYDIDIYKSIYISPIPDAFKYIKKYPGLILTSNHDEYLKDDTLNELKALPNQEILVFKEGDHSLECDDTVKSIDFLKNAINKVIEFVNQ